VCVCVCEGGKVFAFVRSCVYMWFSNVCVCFVSWLCFMRVPAVVFDVCACVAAVLCILLPVCCVFWLCLCCVSDLIGFMCV